MMKIEVLVCGGGCAGLGAAMGAARSGASVLLVERAPFSGGIITTVGLPFLDGLACWETGRVVVKGLALEMLHRMGRAPKDVKNIEEIRCTQGCFTRHGSVAIPCIDEFKLAADAMLQESGVRILYHAMVCGAEVSRGRISRVLVACKDGLLRIEPHVVIDATGDADVAHFCGCPMDCSQERMPMTMHFRIGHVQAGPEMYKHASEALRRATQDGALPMYYGPGLCRAFAKDEIYVHAVRVPGNATDAFDLTRAEIQGRRDAWTMWQYWKKHVPGFENSYFIGSGPFIGVRETRRIDGLYVLSEDDLVQRRSFDDSIATGSWYIDAHQNRTTTGSAHPKEESLVKLKPYDIPYRSLLPRNLDNLLVAGRCHSATRRAAASTRVTVTAMALGEAAGTAAGIYIRSGKPLAGMMGPEIREALRGHNAGPFTYE